MADVKFKRIANSSTINDYAVDDGAFWVTGDGKSYIDYGQNRIPTNGTLDSQMSDISRNAVENKVIKEYVDNKILTIYSTTETIIGTWINEKPIYRTIVYLSSLPNSTSVNYNHNISNIDEFINIRGIATRSSDGFTTILGSTRTNSQTAVVDMYANKTNISITTGMDRSNMHAYIFLEYTKTTD